MILEEINQLIFNITSSPLFLVVKFILLTISLFFIVIIVFVLITTTWLKRLVIWDLKEFMTFRHYGLPRLEKKWAKIKERLEVGTEAEAKLAIIEAEDIFDDILKRESFLGQTFDERLSKLNTNILSNLEEIREVHKVRSSIIHDPSYRLDIKEAERVLDVYEDALVELEAL